MWDVLLAPFRSRGQIKELAAQLQELTARVRAEEHALSTLQSVIGELSRLQQTQQEHLVEWQRSAEQHLAGLQAGHESLARQQAALESPLRADALQPIIKWIQSAEAHLQSLQVESEYIRTLTERHETQLTRAVLLLSSLEIRTGDLERADTDIALTMAQRSGDAASR